MKTKEKMAENDGMFHNRSMNGQTKLIEKIRSLFRLADATRGASQAEAELAMEKAIEIMTKHGIARIEVEQVGAEANEARTFNVHEVRFNTNRRRGYEDIRIATILRNCFNVRVLWSTHYEHEVVDGQARTRRDGRGRLIERLCYILVGEPDATAVAQVVITELHVIMSRLFKDYLKDQGLPWNAVLCHSFHDGLRDGFIDASKKGEETILAATDGAKVAKYELMVVDISHAINTYVKTNIPTKSSGFQHGPRDGGFSDHAYTKGHEAGGKIKVGLRKIEN